MFQNMCRAPEVRHFAAQGKGQCQFTASTYLLPAAATGDRTTKNQIICHNSGKLYTFVMSGH